MAITLGINGAAGRMGRRLVALAHEDPNLQVVAALEHAGHPDLGRDAGELAGVGEIGVPLSEAWSAKPSVLIDFSVPKATRKALTLCRAQGVAMVIGTTGLSAEDEAAIDAAATEVTIVQAANFSRVVNVLRELAVRAATLLGPDYDMEVLEAHHRFKKDAPSGTALMLTRALCEAAGRSFEKDVRFERHGDDAPRRTGEITVQTLRIGDDPGQHTLFFAGLGERLELKHVSTSRDSYALGALEAAKWVATPRLSESASEGAGMPNLKPAGRYSMKDVLGL